MSSLFALALAVLAAQAPVPSGGTDRVDQRRERMGRAIALLTYVVAEYRSAVGPSGELLSEEEHREQIAFVSQAAGAVRQEGGAPELAAALEGLREAVEKRESPDEVVKLAGSLQLRIAQRFQVSMLPERAPNLARGKKLYQAACAACHGADGTPTTVLELPTRPTAFSPREALGSMSPQRVFAATSYGVPNTAMPEFGETVSEGDRWSVAFYALTLSHRGAPERARGVALLRTATGGPGFLELSVRTDDQLRGQLAAARISPADREAIVAALRAGIPPGPARPGVAPGRSD